VLIPLAAPRPTYARRTASAIFVLEQSLGIFAVSPEVGKSGMIVKRVSKAAAAAGPLLPGSPLLSGSHVQVHCPTNCSRIHLRQIYMLLSLSEKVLIIKVKKKSVFIL
jgi:hypothetical protein